MAPTDEDTIQLFKDLSGIKEIERLSLQDVRTDPWKFRYVMIELRGTGNIYEVTWDAENELVVFTRILRVNDRGPRLIARVTLNTGMGDAINLRNPDKKSRVSSYTLRGKLVSAISSPRRIPFSEMWRVLDYFSHRS